MAQGQMIRPLTGLARAFAALQGRLYQAPPMTISGVSEQSWPSALQPVQPVGPAGSQPLSWSFWEGVNLNITPRPDSDTTFEDLRTLGTYSLARICIENSKDQLSSIPWTIQLREIPGESPKDRRQRQQNDDIVPKLKEFFAYPDGETPWKEWVRPLLEDMLVIDAGNVLIRKTLTGKIVQLRVTDGAQYLRLIDDQGYTPPPPSPAYTQLWEGIPRIMLTTDQLVYRPRNIVPRSTVSSHLYGFSPTEQLKEDIKIGSARLNYVLAFYTEGSVPGIVQMVPPDASPDKIGESMQWMNSDLAGNLAKRRQWRMVQSFSGDNQNGPKDAIHQLKEPVLADLFDDTHIRKVCFGYGTSPQRLLKMIRTEGQSSNDSAAEEGMMPFLSWLKGTMDLIIQKKMGYVDHEWVPDTATELDPSKQSDIDDKDLRNGKRTLNEVREARGWEAYPYPEANQPMIYLPTGPVPLGGTIDRLNANDNQQEDDKSQDNPGGDVDNPTSGSNKLRKKKVGTALEIRTDRLTDKSERMIEGLTHRISRFFDGQKKSLIEQISKLYEHAITKASTSSIFDLPTDPDDPEERKLREDTRRALAILGLMKWGWGALADEVQPYLDDAGKQGITVGAAQVNDGDGIAPSSDDSGAVTTDDLSFITEAVEAFSKYRSAEMVGMKRLDDGSLVENPNAEWAISDTTRKDLQDTITQALLEGWTISQLAAVIEGAYTFSSERAELIARTEMSRAQSMATYALWQADPKVKQISWQTTEDEAVCDVCAGYEDLGKVPIGYEFAPGVKAPPDHPRCRCILIGHHE